MTLLLFSTKCALLHCDIISYLFSVAACCVFHVRLTAYFPALVYLYTGFWADEVPLSPKFQDQEVGEFELLSLNFTVRGTFPDVGDAEKAATGG